MDQPLVTPPSEQAKIDALRASIIGVEEATHARFAEDTKDLEPLKPIPKPVAIDLLIKVLKKKEIPFLLIYVTGNDKERHANFATTLEHPAAADMCHHVIEANRAAFGQTLSKTVPPKGVPVSIRSFDGRTIGCAIMLGQLVHDGRL